MAEVRETAKVRIALQRLHVGLGVRSDLVGHVGVTPVRQALRRRRESEQAEVVRLHPGQQLQHGRLEDTNVSGATRPPLVLLGLKGGQLNVLVIAPAGDVLQGDGHPVEEVDQVDDAAVPMPETQHRGRVAETREPLPVLGRDRHPWGSPVRFGIHRQRGIVTGHFIGQIQPDQVRRRVVTPDPHGTPLVDLGGHKRPEALGVTEADTIFAGGLPALQPAIRGHAQAEHMIFDVFQHAHRGGQRLAIHEDQRGRVGVGLILTDKSAFHDAPLLPAKVEVETPTPSRRPRSRSDRSLGRIGGCPQSSLAALAARPEPWTIARCSSTADPRTH